MLEIWGLSYYLKFNGVCFQIDGDGNQPARVSGSAKELFWAKPLLKFASDNFLPLGKNICNREYLHIKFVFGSLAYLYL